MSKGSDRRPLKVSEDAFADNWARIFGSDAPKPNGAACASKAICLVGSIPTGAAIYVDDETGK